MFKGKNVKNTFYFQKRIILKTKIKPSTSEKYKYIYLQ